jgi:hypothetical protein
MAYVNFHIAALLSSALCASVLKTSKWQMFVAMLACVFFSFLKNLETSCICWVSPCLARCSQSDQ